jgi:REP element-mobilizing transposase RayT
MKRQFIRLMQDKVCRYQVRLLAFCLMDNHYHLVLQNSSGRMSDFFRSLNSQYGAWLQWTFGGNGYVFQGRFHSTLIQEEDYLETAILYVLANPVRAGLVERCERYPFSSAPLYGTQQAEGWLDSGYVLDRFGDRKGLFQAAARYTDSRLDARATAFGPVLGDPDFQKAAVARFDRRSTPDPIQHRRKDDFYFLPVEQVMRNFEQSRGVRINDMDTRTYAGKRLRGELLVALRDKAGLTLKEISEIDLFADIQYKSLSQIYANARKN